MMKKIFIIAICFLTVQSYGQNNFVGTNRIGDTAKLIGVVGIGTEIPVASAKLEIVSTTKGLLIPRMTYAQRNAISSPATGLIIFNTQTNKINWYTGSTWLVPGDSASSSADGNGIYGGSGSLTANPTTVTQSTNQIIFTNALTSSTTGGFHIQGTGSGGLAAKITASGGKALVIDGESGGSTVLTVDGYSTGFAAQITANGNGTIIYGSKSSSTTNAVATNPAIQINRTVSGGGTAAAGIGFFERKTIQNGSGSLATAAEHVYKLTTVTNGAEVSEYSIKVNSAGTPTERFVLSGSGALKLNAYTATGSFTVTPIGMLVYDASGNVGTQAITTTTESTYTPTLTNTTNIAASTPYTTYYVRIGDYVHVWGTVDVDATTSLSVCEMGMSLPVASEVGQIYSIAGTAAFEDNTSVQIKGDVTNDRAVWRFTPQSATNNKYSFHFSYKYVAP